MKMEDEVKKMEDEVKKTKKYVRYFFKTQIRLS